MKEEEWEKWKDAVLLTEARIVETEKANVFLSRFMQEPIEKICEMCKTNHALVERIIISRNSGKAHPTKVRLCEECAKDLDKKYKKFEF